MNAQQQQKAFEALDRQREKEGKQRLAMMYHLMAHAKLHYEGNYKGLPLNSSGLSDLKADIEYKEKYEEYKQRVKSEKMSVDKWGYYYARFLLPYNPLSFTDFDFWGEIPKNEEEKQVVDNLRTACVEVQTDCREHPEEYNLEPIPRLEEHKTIYDVPYGYI